MFIATSEKDFTKKVLNRRATGFPLDNVGERLHKESPEL